MKKCVLFILLLALFSFTCAASAPDVSASSAVVMVADTAEVVFEKNAYEKRPMASTTKIMTALLTVECATPSRTVVTTAEMVNVEGTSMGLKAGDKVTFHDLVYGMLLASGNDAANTAAISIDGSIEAFARRMNAKATQIGMSDTHFVTPSGLDDQNHYSTAYDMALLGCYALRNPEFRKACSSTGARLCYGQEPYVRYLSNHNKLLKSFEGAIGIKTGFTKKSGRCLVSAAVRNGVTLVCVTLNAPDDWNDHRRLLEYGFSCVTAKQLNVSLPELDVYGAESSTISLMTSEPVTVALFSDESEITTQILLKKFELAPVQCGDVVGCVRVLVNGNAVDEIPIVSYESLAAVTVPTNEEPTLFFRVKTFLSKVWLKIHDFFRKADS